MSTRPVKRIVRSSAHNPPRKEPLRRAFGFGDTKETDPFLLFDDFRGDNPTDYSAGFPWHPHRSIETEQAIRILKNCGASLPADGRVLVVEFVLPTLVNQVDPALERCLMSDLNMLAVTGGRERTEADWIGVIEKAGLQFMKTMPIAGDLASVIEIRGGGVSA